MEERVIIKLKKHFPKNYSMIHGSRELAEKILGKLKVADSFLYLYQRFGKPNRDNNDEYKISYEYFLKYGEMIFNICATTPEYVYVDCYVPKSWRKYLISERYNWRCKEIFTKAFVEKVLFFPYSMHPTTNMLNKRQLTRWNLLFDEEARLYFDKETYKIVDEFDWENTTKEEKNKMWKNYLTPFFEHLQKKFMKWAEKDPAIYELFYSSDELRFIPEKAEIVREFCEELLKTIPIRDCDINIRGWQ